MASARSGVGRKLSVLAKLRMGWALTRGKIIERRPAVNNVWDLFGVGGLVIVPTVGDDGVEGVLIGSLGDGYHGSLSRGQCHPLPCINAELTMIMSRVAVRPRSKPLAGAIPPKAS